MMAETGVVAVVMAQAVVVMAQAVVAMAQAVVATAQQAVVVLTLPVAMMARGAAVIHLVAVSDSAAVAEPAASLPALPRNRRKRLRAQTSR